MSKMRVASRVGMILSLFAIFFAAVGIDFVHEALHQSHYFRAYQITSESSTGSVPLINTVKPSKENYGYCPICAFLSNFQLIKRAETHLVSALFFVQSIDAPLKILAKQSLILSKLNPRAPPSVLS